MLARLLASKLVVAAGVASLALAGAIALGAVATPALASAPSIAATAAKAGPSRLAQILDTLVRNGTITADQRDKILAAFHDAAQDDARGLAAFRAQLVKDAADAIGISVGDLKKELPGKSLAQVARAHGVSRDALIAALTTSISADIDKLVSENKITSERAATLKQKLPDFLAKAVDRVHRDGRGLAIARDLLRDAADAIGITPQQLRQELAGSSVAKVAQAHGVSRDVLVAKLTTAETARIDKALADGAITADQAARLKAGLNGTLMKFVDRTFPQKGHRS